MSESDDSAEAPRIAFEVLTLFPDAVQSFASAGLLGRAIERGLVAVHCTDIRAFATDRHRTVDDAPFGGGAGMVMKPEPVVAALEAVVAERGPMHRVLLTPSAPRLDQRSVERLAKLPRIALVCGRYEGIDDRVREHFVDECISLGDFVLGGGEVAALAVIEAVARLQGGVVGNPASVTGDSFSADDDVGPRLEHPQYTRPALFRGHAVPDVLLGGDHAAIERWRTSAALRRTWALRPDLRVHASLPEGASIHLAVAPDGIDDATALAELVRAHALAGLVLVGASEDEVLSWTRETAGRCTLTAFASVPTLRRRMKRAGATWLVALVAGSRRAVPVEAVLDELRACTRAQPSGLVLLAGLGADDADAVWPVDGPPGRASTHAPDPARRGAEPDQAVAAPAAIADSSPPSSRAALVASALTSLAAVRRSRSGRAEE